MSTPCLDFSRGRLTASCAVWSVSVHIDIGIPYVLFPMRCPCIAFCTSTGLEKPSTPPIHPNGMAPKPSGKDCWSHAKRASPDGGASKLTLLESAS